VRIQLAERPVLAVPARAIRREDGRSVVYVQIGNRIEPRPVRTGWRDGSWVEIAQGLAAGDKVLVDPPQAPGEAVQ
jgi:HlyD family secretion protein